MCSYVYVCIRVYLCIYACVCACICICLRACVCASLKKHTHTCTHAYKSWDGHSLSKYQLWKKPTLILTVPNGTCKTRSTLATVSVSLIFEYFTLCTLRLRAPLLLSTLIRVPCACSSSVVTLISSRRCRNSEQMLRGMQQECPQRVKRGVRLSSLLRWRCLGILLVYWQRQRVACYNSSVTRKVRKKNDESI